MSFVPQHCRCSLVDGEEARRPSLSFACPHSALQSVSSRLAWTVQEQSGRGRQRTGKVGGLEAGGGPSCSVGGLCCTGAEAGFQGTGLRAILGPLQWPLMDQEVPVPMEVQGLAMVCGDSCPIVWRPCPLGRAPGMVALREKEGGRQVEKVPAALGDHLSLLRM